VPTDYDEIRAENISRYGWDTAVLELLGQLYSERAHFIFELIQNAEDAGATELTFELFGDRLEVRHDGRPFTAADVRGICGVGQGTKAEDLTQIGKFGIGFKSVYAYTDAPRIYSSDEHFRIEKYVRPYSVDPLDRPAAGTVFVFPFDRAEVPTAVAVQEISAALSSIDVETLLFLRSIERVRSCGLQTGEAVLERTSTTGAHSGRHVRLASRRGERRSDEEWLVWHRQLDALGEPEHRVEIAFMARTEIDARRLVRRESSPLVVFFPTQKETFLGFLIQGPYRTTPARLWFARPPACSSRCLQSSVMEGCSRPISSRRCRWMPLDSRPRRCSAPCSNRLAPLLFRTSSFPPPRAATAAPGR
jgi:hypothetical protein